MLELIKTLNPLIVSLITVVGGAALKFYFESLALKKKYASEVKENSTLKSEIADRSLSLQMDLELLNSIKGEAESILYNTKADRFLILSATNGSKDMRFATAVYEQHKNAPEVKISLGATGKYVRFEFDSQYRKMLKEAELNGVVDLDVGAMVDCDLKSIYSVEKVKFSQVHFLMRVKIDKDNDRIFYCSIATHNKEPFSNLDKIIIKTKIDKIKHLLTNSDHI